MFTRSTMLTLATAALALAPLRAPDLPTQLLPVYGGSGGTTFSRSCGADKVVTGLRYRSGISVDAIGLLCRPVNANGTLGSETSVGTLAGGGGGIAGTKSCDPGHVLVGAHFHYGALLDGISELACRAWSPATRSFGTTPNGPAGVIGRLAAQGHAYLKCEANTQPIVAIRGRAGALVDALGFNCDEP